MSPEHDPDPLVRPRGDDEPGSPDPDPFDQDSGAGGSAEPERVVSAEPVGAGGGEAGDEPLGSAVAPTEPVVDEAAGSRDTVTARPGRGGRRSRGDSSPNMLPGRHSRSEPERLFVRLIATGGVVAIGVAIAAIMRSSGSQGWIIGLVVSIVSVCLAALLWSSRVL